MSGELVNVPLTREQLIDTVVKIINNNSPEVAADLIVDGLIIGASKGSKQVQYG
jgi:hypothetical protein